MKHNLLSLVSSCRRRFSGSNKHAQAQATACYKVEELRVTSCLEEAILYAERAQDYA